MGQSNLSDAQGSRAIEQLFDGAADPDQAAGVSPPPAPAEPPEPEDQAPTRGRPQVDRK
ncbi:MAG TPA: hypothetical protein VFR41_09610 [Acidimicrobiia bacterium]|nr:hypothetical protein [Acidimicrobiia bacterium]